MKDILGIDHISFAVKNLEEAKQKFLSILPVEEILEETVAEQKVKVVSLKVFGINLELVQPLNEESTVQKFLAKRGEGVHHLAFKVNNLKSLLKEIEAVGISLIDKEPKIGAHNKKIAFLHPKSTNGVLIELCEEIK